MNIAVLGASGFIGQNLIRYLQKQNIKKIVALSPDPEKIEYLKNKSTKVVKTDVFNIAQLKTNLQNAEVIYYLIHMMGQNKFDFYNAESTAATNIANIVKNSNTKKIIYLSGLGKDTDNLSKHLASRHNTGKILLKSGVQVVEIRASMIIGEGSIGYETIKKIVNLLPIIPLPKGYNTKTQPIGLEDALKYLYSALWLKENQNLVIEIGGPEKLTYKQLFEKYARFRGKNILYITKPAISAKMAKFGLNTFLENKYSQVTSAMIDSLNNEMTVTKHTATKVFPQIKPKSIEKFFS